jgi:hypothetical protein
MESAGTNSRNPPRHAERAATRRSRGIFKPGVERPFQHSSRLEMYSTQKDSSASVGMTVCRTLSERQAAERIAWQNGVPQTVRHARISRTRSVSLGSRKTTFVVSSKQHNAQSCCAVETSSRKRRGRLFQCISLLEPPPGPKDPSTPVGMTRCPKLVGSQAPQARERASRPQKPTLVMPSELPRGAAPYCGQSRQDPSVRRSSARSAAW